MAVLHKNPLTLAKHLHKGKRWLPEVEQELIADYENGASLSDLVESYGRTKKSIVARLQKHGAMGYDPDEMEIYY